MILKITINHITGNRPDYLISINVNDQISSIKLLILSKIFKMKYTLLKNYRY